MTKREFSAELSPGFPIAPNWGVPPAAAQKRSILERTWREQGEQLNPIMGFASYAGVIGLSLIAGGVASDFPHAYSVPSEQIYSYVLSGASLGSPSLNKQAKVDVEERLEPSRTWSVSLVDIGDERFRLKYPLIIMLEDYASEIIASWPEVEAWGAGSSEAMAINALKDDMVRLCEELLLASTEKLGKLPRRWVMSLKASVFVVGAPKSDDERT